MGWPTLFQSSFVFKEVTGSGRWGKLWRKQEKRWGKKPLSSVLVAGVSYPCQSTKMRDNECLTELG